MQKIFNSEKILNNKKALFFTGCLIGFIVFVSIFTFSTLNVTNDTFFTQGFIEKDVAQHYSGWMLFRQSDWQFPLGLGENMAFPYSSSVSYTDSIPLFAIFFKLLSPLLPATFQYFGIFVCLCYMLMGGFSALLMHIFTSPFSISCLSSIIFCFSPVMAERAFRHTALTAHFLIIASLYYYFKNKGNWQFNSTIPFIIINSLAITIHPYFLPFTFGISFAFYLQWVFAKKQFIKPFLFIAISLVSTFITGYSIGAFHSIGSAGDIGYGLFSLNLNSYYNPLSPKLIWSNFVQPRPLNTSYQQEAFNYLGLGLLLALCLTVLLIVLNKNIRKIVFNYIKENIGLIVVTAILTIFALTNTVTYHSSIIFNINLPSTIMSLASIFRASGRFGWLLHYIIYIVVIFVISSIKLKIKILPQLLLFALITVNICDIYPVLSLKNNYFSGNGYDGDSHTMHSVLTDNYWDTATDDFDKIILFETNLYQGAIDIAILAGKANNDIKVNLAFEARAENDNRHEFLSAVHNDLIDGIIDESTLYVVTDVYDYEEHLQSGEYQLIKVDGQLLMFKTRYTDNELQEFDNSNSFEIVNINNLPLEPVN